VRRNCRSWMLTTPGQCSVCSIGVDAFSRIEPWPEGIAVYHGKRANSPDRDVVAGTRR
jgi:hypothetical protein